MVFPSVWNLHPVTETFLRLCLKFCDVCVTYIKIYYSMSVFLWKLIEVFGCQYFLITRALMTAVLLFHLAASSGPLPWLVAKKCYFVAMLELFLWFTKLAKNILFLYSDASESPKYDVFLYCCPVFWLTESQPSEKHKIWLLCVLCIH